MLFLVAEVTILLSNLYKSGFVSYSEQNTLVIDANKNHVLRQIDEDNQRRRHHATVADDNDPDGVLADEDGESEEDFQGFEIENIDMADVREQANAVFEDAQAASERILEEARAEALMLKEEAKQAGREEGYQKGLEEAKTQMAAQEAELQNRYELVRQQLENDYEKQLLEAEPRMVDIICGLLHKISGVMIGEEQGVMVHIIHNALLGIENTDSVSVKVSEDDYAEVYSRYDWLKQQINSNITMELVSDVKLGKNQCMIETENGIINCSLDEQLNHLINSLKLLSEL